MQKGGARNNGRGKGGDRKNRALRLVTVIYDSTAITLLAVGQHHSPSHGASLDLTVLQVQQDEKFWRQQSRIKHILWLFKEKSAAPCPIHGAGEWRKRRGLTPVPPQRDRRQSGSAAKGMLGCSTVPMCTMPCALIPQPPQQEWALTPPSDGQKAQQASSRHLLAHCSSQCASLLTEPGHCFSLIRLQRGTSKQVTSASRVLQGIPFWKETWVWRKGLFFPSPP